MGDSFLSSYDIVIGFEKANWINGINFNRMNLRNGFGSGYSFPYQNRHDYDKVWKMVIVILIDFLK